MNVLQVLLSLRKTVHVQCPNVLNALDRRKFGEVTVVKNVKLILDGIYRRVLVVHVNIVLVEISFVQAMEHVSMVVNLTTIQKTKDVTCFAIWNTVFGANPFLDMEKYAWDVKLGTFLKTMVFVILVANIAKVDQQSVIQQQVRVSMDVKTGGLEIVVTPLVMMNTVQNATILEIHV